MSKGRAYETIDRCLRLCRAGRRVGRRDDGGSDGRADADLVARACDLGVAMQLTNIARDVGEDARAGRLYLPRAWLREAGSIRTPGWRGRSSDRSRAVVARLLAGGRSLRRADAALRLDPAFGRPSSPRDISTPTSESGLSRMA